MLNVKRITLGVMKVNCYIIYNDNKNAIIVDPGTSGNRTIDFIDNNNLSVKAIILTHGHFDHIQATDQLVQYYHCDLLVHECDADLLIDPKKNASNMIGKSIIVEARPTKFVEHHQDLLLDQDKITVIHTPGHTPGGICLLTENFVIVGDTLFQGSYGRTDFPKGNQKQLFDSIRHRLLTLDENLIVYPGHGDSTVIKHEKSLWL